jgi:hypothetical protein
MKEMIRKYSKPSGRKKYASNSHVVMEAIVITKVVAIPIPRALLIFPDTPMNGHNPKKLTNTTLFTNAALNKISNPSVMLHSIFSKYRSNIAQHVPRVRLAPQMPEMPVFITLIQQTV